jgi:DNA-binding transcriptional regulator GbsR (MarR family)
VEEARETLVTQFNYMAARFGIFYQKVEKARETLVTQFNYMAARFGISY